MTLEAMSIAEINKVQCTPGNIFTLIYKFIYKFISSLIIILSQFTIYNKLYFISTIIVTQCNYRPAGLCLGALSKVPIEIYKFLIEVPFAKEKSPCPFKYEVLGVQLLYPKNHCNLCYSMQPTHTSLLCLP